MIILHFALYLGLLFLLVQLFIFILNNKELGTLPIDYTPTDEIVSILVPARNEETNIGNLLSSFTNQSYANFELLVLDDNSTDKTGIILSRFVQDNPNVSVKVIHGQPKPDNWLGKNWACHQLAKSADGRILVFIDADTTVESTFVQSIVSAYKKYQLDALTVWPEQKLVSFWERMVVPQMYFVIYSLLPIRYTHSDPTWMPKKLIPGFRASFAAACGQCMSFTQDAYRFIGGHKAVKDQVVEDVQLAKKIRSANKNFRMFHGSGSLSCRMYTSEPEILMGFRKNFLAGFNNNIPFFLFSWILHLSGYVLPWLLLPFSVINGNLTLSLLNLLMILLPIGMRLRIDSINHWKLSDSFLHILGVLWFNRLALIVLWDRLSGKKPVWKNRPV